MSDGHEHYASFFCGLDFDVPDFGHFGFSPMCAFLCAMLCSMQIPALINIDSCGGQNGILRWFRVDSVIFEFATQVRGGGGGWLGSDPRSTPILGGGEFWGRSNPQSMEKKVL